MTGQMKQRIVGIVVLVFLALVLLPWLFAKKSTDLFEENKATKKEKRISTDFPEMNQESSESVKPIPDKIDNAQKMSKVQAAEFSATSQSEPQVEESIPTVTSQPSVAVTKKSTENASRVTELNANQIVKIEESIVHSNEEAKEETSAKVAKLESPGPAAKKSNSNSVKSKTNSKSSVVKNSNKNSEKSWNIQLGSFSNKNNATKLLQQLKSKGYDAHIKTSKDAAGKSISRVFVVQSNHQSAESAVKQIDKLFKVHGVIMKASV